MTKQKGLASPFLIKTKVSVSLEIFYILWYNIYKRC